MTISNNCKQCSCFCIATLITMVIIVSATLAFQDFTMISSYETIIEELLNTPFQQLRCLQVCSSWYTQQEGTLCCDRYNSQLCCPKNKCKDYFIEAQNVSIKVLYNDAYNEIWLIFVCGIALIGIFKISKIKNGSVKEQEETQKGKINKQLGQKQCNNSHFQPSEDKKSCKLRKHMSAETAASQTKSIPLNQQYCPCILEFIENHNCNISQEIHSSRFLRERHSQQK